MIIKGGSRGGPEQLARHLQRRDTNERVEILEVLWASSDLKETFRDWQTLSQGTRGWKGLYHVNIDPAEDYAMTKEQWQRCVEVLEKELGFEGLPRAVVMHKKHGREHIHIVWARTDTDTMTLRTDSMNYLAHERASKVLELEFGHELVPGKHDKRDREKQEDFPEQEMSHAEWQQYERTGVHPRERREDITALRQASDSAQAFRAALEDSGYLLAKGDRRDFVIVDETGEICSLGRQMLDMKAPALREFMKGIDKETLPTAKEAVKLQQQKQDEKRQATADQAEKPAPEQPQPVEQKKGLSPEEIRAIENAVADRQTREAADMRQRQQAEFRHTRKVLDNDMAESIRHFEARQQAERERFERENLTPEGLERMLEAIQRWWNPKLAAERDADRQRRQEKMEQRQRQERQNREKQLREARDLELENLTERHEQQLRDHTTKTAEDLDRHLREADAARRLQEEIRERERQEEQERREHGPEWPPPNRAR